MNLTSVAWVPDDDPERDWGIAVALAVEWVEERCRDQDASGALVTNGLDYHGVPELDGFERRNSRTSRRAGAGRVSFGRGPVLSYVPYVDDLEFAMNLARNSSIAVVETLSFPVRGWAAWLGAWNLVADEPTPPLDGPMREGVDRLACYANNGFGDDFGKRRALSILGELLDQFGAGIELLPSATLAAGVSARGVTNLSRLIEKLG